MTGFRAKPTTKGYQQQLQPRHTINCQSPQSRLPDLVVKQRAFDRASTQ